MRAFTAWAGLQLLTVVSWCILNGGASASSRDTKPVLHRLQPASGRIVHMAGQSATEFRGYNSFLPVATRPVALTQYFSLSELLEDDHKAERYFTEIRQELDGLGDTRYVVLPHISISLTQNVNGHTDGTSVPAAIIAGKYDAALQQFADAVPLIGRPLFLRIGYEFNGHWNNYSAPEYVQAWRRIEAALAANKTTRDTIALVWDMSCDAVPTSDACVTAADCWSKYWPGDDVVDWTGVNVFQSGRGRQVSMLQTHKYEHHLLTCTGFCYSCHTYTLVCRYHCLLVGPPVGMDINSFCDHYALTGAHNENTPSYLPPYSSTSLTHP